MKLSEGVLHEGKPFVIPDCPRSNLPDFFKEMGFKVGAEIGVYKGGFTEKFCKAGLKMFAIDPWEAYQGAGRTQAKQDRQNFLYSHTRRTLEPYDCEIIRSRSMEALRYFEDEYLDFVYIDGDHSFKYFAEDIVEWTKKVRPGGIVSGHDYFYYGPQSTNLICQVGPVLDAYVEAFRIKSFWVFGEDKSAPDKDDRYPSWMFRK